MKRLPAGQLAVAIAGLFSLLHPLGAVQAQDPFQIAREEAAVDAAPASKGNATTSSDRSTKPAVEKDDRIFKTPEQWQKQLTHEQFMVARMKATEPAFSGKYAQGHFRGIFECVCCGEKLFDSRNKFESGTGWPSFWRAINEKAIETAWDYSDPAEARVEVTCRRCGAHLGHVFQDGPQPTGLRFCINSASLKLDPEKETTAPTKNRKAARSTTAKTSRKPSTAKTTKAPATPTSPSSS